MHILYKNINYMSLKLLQPIATMVGHCNSQPFSFFFNCVANCVTMVVNKSFAQHNITLLYYRGEALIYDSV